MYISSRQLANYLMSTSENVNDLLTLLDESKILVHRFGKLLLHSSVLEKVYNLHEDMGVMIQILFTTGFATKKSIQSISDLVKEKSKNYTKTIHCIGNIDKVYDKIEHVIKNDIGVSISYEPTKSKDITLHGEGYYFHRNIDNDIKNLLNI